MFDQVAIIGCGLIGSSVFRALKKNGSVKKIITFDTNNSVAEIIKKENLSDEIVSNPEAAVKNADLVLVATPLSSFESAINSIKEFLKPSSILTDTSSVKTSVDKIVKKMLHGSQDILLLGLKKVAQEQVLLIYLRVGGLYLLQRQI